MSDKKLSKSQRQLFKTWEAEYRSQMGAFSGVLNENLNLKLERIAEELGINIEDGGWNFDARTMAFTKPDEPKPEIPGRNVGKPKKEAKAINAEVVK